MAIDRVLDRARQHVTPLLDAGETIEIATVAALKRPTVKAQAATAVAAMAIGAVLGGAAVGVRVPAKQFVFLTNRRLVGVRQRPGGPTIKATGGIAWAIDREQLRATDPYTKGLWRCFDLLADDASIIATMSFPTPARADCDAISELLGRAVVTPAPAPAGWLPDPSGRQQARYWDGTTWTGFVIDHAGQQLFEGAQPQTSSGSPS